MFIVVRSSIDYVFCDVCLSVCLGALASRLSYLAQALEVFDHGPNRIDVHV